MDPSVKLHLGKYQRYLWEDTGLLIVIGEYPEVKISRELYEQRHDIKPSTGQGAIDLDRLMGAAALAAVSLAERESWGWTLTMPGSDKGFFCGVEPEGMICGNIQDAEESKTTVFLQRRKNDGPLVQSNFEPLATDPLDVINRYFEQVVQTKTRIALDDNCSGVLVQAMPDSRFAEIADLENSQLIDLCRGMALRGELKPMHEVVMFYECRCEDQMILDMITSLPDAQRKEIWGTEEELFIECPRCGREYKIQKKLQ